ncbi:MAG: hypothetical protein ABI233_06965 [Chthoniobacterales bacterium]
MPKSSALAAGLLNTLASSCRLTLNFIHGDGCYPADQVIRYPHPPGYARYTFSLCAFPEEDFVQNLRAYYAFCHDYARDHGYRCDLINFDYRMKYDQRALLSFTYDSPVMTIDPASTGGDGWLEFLDACNEFCKARGASPLFNQTPHLTPGQVQKAIGDRIGKFREFMNRYDPEQLPQLAFRRALWHHAVGSEQSAVVVLNPLQGIRNGSGFLSRKRFSGESKYRI